VVSLIFVHQSLKEVLMFLLAEAIVLSCQEVKPATSIPKLELTLQLEFDRFEQKAKVLYIEQVTMLCKKFRITARVIGPGVNETAGILVQAQSPKSN
jgi:hypothetical protein